MHVFINENINFYFHDILLQRKKKIIRNLYSKEKLNYPYNPSPILNSIHGTHLIILTESKTTMISQFFHCLYSKIQVHVFTATTIINRLLFYPGLYKKERLSVSGVLYVVGVYFLFGCGSPPTTPNTGRTAI